MSTPMIEVDAVTKRFGSTRALGGVDLTVAKGTVIALLGPNGAGKTTLVRILTTLLRPDSGHARVAGYDVVTDAKSLRSVIGLAGQYAAVDELLTGRENLELVGLWYHLDKQEYRRRAQEILERFSLTEAGNSLVKTYSGGMRRRLDIGASLVARPPVLFLDEPTTGLDPRTRNDVWRFIEELVAADTTVLLTTQYMEEAERLAQHIVVIDGGRVIADGTVEHLKQRLGGDLLEARVTDPGDLPRAAALLAELAHTAPRVDPLQQRVAVPTTGGTSLLIAAGRRFDDDGIALVDYVVPAVFLEAVLIGGMTTSIGLAQDIKSGIIDRFRSLPMARSAVLAGRTLTDLARSLFALALMVGLGLLVGFRFHTTIPSIIAGMAIIIYFGYAFSWMYATIGLATKDPETAQVAGILPFFVLMFASSAVVPVATMPGWLQPFARNQPFSVTVATIRALLEGGPVFHWLWQSLAWSTAILVVFFTLAVRLYRDITS